MKRGLSGLSLVVGVNKPLGMSSHDVVNSCRRIFSESRIGHTGTLDPEASGVLMLCIGPATRLNPFMTMHDKSYQFKVSFGAATDTDDSSGQILRTGDVPEEVYDPLFARNFIEGLVGTQQQVPPIYSAIKVKGERSYKAARAGNIVELEQRDIEVYQAELVGIEEAGSGGFPSWEVSVHVSKGTYIRSLARDIGTSLGVPAHLSQLCRKSLGLLKLDECLSLEELAEQKMFAAIDPVRLLGFRLVFVSDERVRTVQNGVHLPAKEILLFSYPRSDRDESEYSRNSVLHKSEQPLVHNELISVIADNKLLALYQFDQETQTLKACCVFSVEVSRGNN